jgi:hypothetical protein
VDLALPAIIGVGLALGAFVLGRVVGLDRDRAFYTTALIVIAALYDLFAVMRGSTKALAHVLRRVRRCRRGMPGLAATAFKTQS